MYHDKDSAQRIHPQGHKTLFILRIWIFRRQGVIVAQSGFGMSKTHPMLAQIACRLGGVEFDFHVKTIHIMSALVKVLDYGLLKAR